MRDDTAGVDPVTSLIHLNGPPGIGKSTLAELYVERHPGALDLDIDALHRLVGGWRDPDNRTHDVLRPVALAMAGSHLAGGRDVVLPQFLGRIEEINAFERVAGEHGADFREVVLLNDKDEALARFDRRVAVGEWDEHNRRLVESMGGRDMLAAMYERLIEVIARRPRAAVVRSEPEEIEQTYQLVLRALER